MLQSILRAFLRALVTLFLAMTFTFVILRVSGDPLHSLHATSSLAETLSGA